jgi:acyl-CoA thioesterase-2
MNTSFESLLPIAPIGEDRFVVRPPGSGFLFGGLSMAMVLRGAAQTVDAGQAPMSLQASFLASGDWAGPHELEVERVSDTRSFAVRRIRMITEGRLAVVAEVIFHRPEAGDDWQAAPAPDAPPPATLAPHLDALPMQLIDLRPVAGPPVNRDKLHPFWCRPLEPVGDPALQPCALAYVSDYAVTRSPFPHGSGRSEGRISRTLTHTLAFHRSPGDGAWWFADCDALTVSGGRYLSRGAIQSADGALLASFVQQGYVRSQPADG